MQGENIPCLHYVRYALVNYQLSSSHLSLSSAEQMHAPWDRREAASHFAVKVNQAGSFLMSKMSQGTAPALLSWQGIALLPECLLKL